MEDMINERLILLASAQQHMMDVTDVMDQWEKSQINLEKRSFESMNTSDTVLNLSKEGNRLVLKLQEYYLGNAVCFDSTEIQTIALLLGEVQGLFHNIVEVAATANDISHHLEKEVAFQREIEEGLKNTICQIGESIDSAVACAEFLLAEI